MGLFDDLIPQNSNTISPRGRDLAIRTIYGEAANEPDAGKLAVASVIRNRLQNGGYGKSLQDVVLAKNQFEPWWNADRRKAMIGLNQNDPAYQSIGLMVDSVFSGQASDPTGGALNFYSPSAQAALGRQPPSWAQGDGLMIGRHAFYGGTTNDISAKSKSALSFDDLIPQNAKDSSFDSRLNTGNFTSANPDELRAGLENKANEIAQGPQVSPAQSMAIDFQNILPAATQGTSPNVNQYHGKLISSDAFQSDSGEIMYRDPATGQVVPTDSNTQVAIRDPADNTVKIFERSDATNENPAIGVARVLSPGLAAGSPTRLPSAASAIAPKVSPSISEIKNAARAGYSSDAVTSLAIKPNALREFGQITRTELNNAGFDENIAPKTFGIISKLDKVPDGSMVTGQNLNSLRKSLRKAAQSIEPQEKKAATEAIKSLDNFVENIPQSNVLSGNPRAAGEAFKEARGNWSAASKAEQIDKKLIQAELRAAAANSGRNVANTIRQRMTDVLVNPKLRQGYKPDELAAMERIVRGTLARNLLRFSGNLMGGGGGIGTVVVGAAGGVATGGPGAAIPAVGYAFRSLSNMLTLRDVDKLSKLIRANSPLAKQMRGPMQSFGKASVAFLSRPGPKTVAAFGIAARNLSNNLRDAGISISPKMIADSLQSPAITNADQNQNEVPGKPSQ